MPQLPGSMEMPTMGRRALKKRFANPERLTAACLLSVIGGFLDIYTYLCRGGVFANAVTGNMVLFGLGAAQQEWGRCGEYLTAIFFYACGIGVAEWLSRKIPASRKITWHQLVILLEILCLIPVCFIDYGRFDHFVNAMISFVCALQVQTFRRVHGLPFASTMCTGNLRSGTEAFFRSLTLGDRSEFTKALHYFGVIFFFIAGAAGGAVLLRWLGAHVILLAPLGLLGVFWLIAPSFHWRIWWRSLKRLRHRDLPQ